MMKLDWSKWGLDFFTSLGRHIGTAGMTWLGLGLNNGKVDWHDLWIALLTGAILPTVFTFLQSSPTPTVITDTTTTAVSVKTTIEHNETPAPASDKPSGA